MWNAVEIINQALSGIGAIPIQSLDDPGPAGQLPIDCYNDTVGGLVGRYPWHFCARFAPLTRLAEGPVRGWTYAYLLPPDRADLPRGYYDSAAEGTRPLTRWEIEGDRLLTSAAAVWADYRWQAPAHLWPQAFRHLVVVATEAKLALAVREDRDLYTRKMTEAFGTPTMNGEGGLMAEAMAADAQAEPRGAPSGGRNPLVDVRWPQGDIRNDYCEW